VSPALSIIIGTYNCADFLPGLFQCVDAETFRDFEIVVVDDASDDGKTIPYLESLGEKIRLIRRDTNSGTCELPRYQGTKAARGAYCAFLDADDRWDPAFLETCMNWLQAHPNTPLVHTYARVIDGQDRVLRIRHENAMPQGDDLTRALLRHCYITISAVVVRRDVWLEAVREEEITDFGMDLDFFLSIARRYPIGFIPEVLASYRRSEASVSVKKWKRSPRNVNTLERILRKGWWEGVAPRAEMKSILVEAYRENAEHARHTGHPKRAIWFCSRGLRHHALDAQLLTTFAKSVIALIRGRIHV